VQYRKEIDGLRAIAVIPVILFHADLQLFNGGFIGVDVFFVISGYLITSIIQRDLLEGTFTFPRFYERRARRILPALFLVTLSTLPFAWFWLLPSEFESFSKSLVALSGFASNILFWRESGVFGGYFAAAGLEKPLLHTWSLAVEEQFYVLYPIFILLFWRIGRHRLFLLIALIALTSLALSEYGQRFHPPANFYLLPTRAWEILIGSLCALHMAKTGQLRSNTISLFGLALIGFSIFSYSDFTPFPSVYALVPVIGAALIILFAAPGTVTAKILSPGIIVGAGLISYGAYLWHYPLFVFARVRSIEAPSSALLSAMVVSSFALAYLSWRFVEQPIRKGVVSSKKFVIGTSSAVVGFVAIGLFGIISDGSETRFAAFLSEDQLAQHQAFVVAAERRVALNDNGDCHFHSGHLDAEYIERIDRCHSKYGAGTLVLGDSHAENVFQAITFNSDDPFIIGLARGFCRPHGETPECFYSQFEEYLRSNSEKIGRVIYAQAGFLLIQDERGTPGTRNFFSKKNLPVYDVNNIYVRRVIQYLESLSLYSRIVWFGPRIEPHIKLHRLYRYDCTNYHPVLKENLAETFLQLDDYLSRVISASAAVSYFSEIDAVNFDINNDLRDCDVVFWSDSDHWSKSGEMRFGHRFVDQLMGQNQD
jgi:peptidoglycan/LPS O-acetylase OafA/YrhL